MEISWNFVSPKKWELYEQQRRAESDTEVDNLEQQTESFTVW